MPVTALVTPGPEVTSDDAHLVGGARVAVGGMHRALLVAHEDVLDPVLLEQLVVDEEHGAAGVAEYVLDPLLLKTADGDLRAGEFHGNRSRTSGNV